MTLLLPLQSPELKLSDDDWVSTVTMNHRGVTDAGFGERSGHKAGGRQGGGQRGGRVAPAAAADTAGQEAARTLLFNHAPPSCACSDMVLAAPVTGHVNQGFSHSMNVYIDTPLLRSACLGGEYTLQHSTVAGRPRHTCKLKALLSPSFARRRCSGASSWRSARSPHPSCCARTSAGARGRA